MLTRCKNTVIHKHIMVCCQGVAVPSFVVACELFAAKYRTFAGIFIGNFWAVAMCVFALLAYLVQNWVHLQLTISLIGLLTIPLYWYNAHYVHLQFTINGRHIKNTINQSINQSIKPLTLNDR